MKGTHIVWNSAGLNLKIWNSWTKRLQFSMSHLVQLQTFPLKIEMNRYRCVCSSLQTVRSQCNMLLTPMHASWVHAPSTCPLVCADLLVFWAKLPSRQNHSRFHPCSKQHKCTFIIEYIKYTSKKIYKVHEWLGDRTLHECVSNCSCCQRQLMLITPRT